LIFSVISADEEIRAIASVASLALALLAFFTNLRFSALKEERGGTVEPFDSDTVLATLPDLGLAAFTGAAVFVMAPLCFASFHFGELGERSSAVPSMFFLIWLGFVAVLIFQLGMAVTRFCDGFKAKTTRSRGRGTKP